MTAFWGASISNNSTQLPSETIRQTIVQMLDRVATGQCGQLRLVFTEFPACLAFAIASPVNSGTPKSGQVASSPFISRYHYFSTNQAKPEYFSTQLTRGAIR